MGQNESQLWDEMGLGFKQYHKSKKWAKKGPKDGNFAFFFLQRRSYSQITLNWDKDYLNPLTKQNQI
jgi:hypothetical protein